MGMMINRRRVCGGGEKLPQGAVRIEYLQGDGNAYIDTGIFIDSTNYVFLLDVIVTDKPSINKALLGVNNNYTVGYPGIILGTSIFSFRYGNREIGKPSISPVVGSEYFLKLSFKKIEINGYEYVTTNTTSWEKMQFTFYLFARNNQGRSGNDFTIPTIWKFKSFMMMNNDNKLLDMIPVRVGQVGYMYDKVSKQLFGNSGTGAFILGNDK